MDYFVLLIAVLALIQGTVEAAKSDQTKCLERDPVAMTGAVRDAIAKKWWFHLVTEVFANPEHVLPKRNKFANQSLQMNILPRDRTHPEEPLTTTIANIFVHNEGNPYILGFIKKYMQTDSVYAVFKGVADSAAIFYNGGTWSKIPLDEAFPTEDSRQIAEFALVTAEQDFLIFLACKTNDFLALISDVAVMGNTEGLHEYDARIIEELQKHNLPINQGNAGDYKVARKNFPFKVNTTKKEVQEIPYVRPVN